MYSKHIVLQWVIFLLGTVQVAGQIQAQIPQGEGFLGLTFMPTLESGSHSTLRGRLPMQVEGASENWEVYTKIQLFNDLLRISNQFGNDPSFLETNQQYNYSLFNMQVDYLTYSFKKIILTGGFGLGHTGFFTAQENTLKYFLYASLRVGARWFISRHFMANMFAEAPLPVYNHNIKNSLLVNSGVQITYDPIGPIENPVPGTALYSAGFEFEAYRYTLNEQNRSATFVRPFLKAMIVY